jgi:hypothetical protein
MICISSRQTDANLALCPDRKPSREKRTMDIDTNSTPLTMLAPAIMRDGYASGCGDPGPERCSAAHSTSNFTGNAHQRITLAKPRAARWKQC